MGRNVTADDPRLETVYQRFRAHLDAICASARASGAAVLLSTVAVNLKDCCSSVGRTRPGPRRRAARRMRRALPHRSRTRRWGKHAEAVAEFQRALAADDRFADAHFCLAQSLLKTGEFENARSHFIVARDLDALRFRADSRINETIREVAGQRVADGVRLVDFEKMLEDKTRPEGSLPGCDYFYEHVHLRPEGNYLLAAAMFRQLAVPLPERVRRKAAGPEEPIPFEVCSRRIALTGWSRLRMEESMATMTNQPPFTQQLDHRRQQVARQAEVRRLRAKYGTAAAQDEAARAYQSVLQSSADKLDLRQCCAELLAERNDFRARLSNGNGFSRGSPTSRIGTLILARLHGSAATSAGALAQFDEAQKAIRPFARRCVHRGDARSMARATPPRPNGSFAGAGTGSSHGQSTE